MTVSVEEKIERSRALPRLDAATVQAVLDLKAAIRRLADLKRESMRALSPAALGLHATKLRRATEKLGEARRGLERLLEEDA